MSKFVMTQDGFVHAMSALAGGEFTLCGTAFDAFADDPDLEFSETRCKTVTCPECAMVVLSCRGIRVSAAAQAQAKGE